MPPPPHLPCPCLSLIVHVHRIGQLFVGSNSDLTMALRDTRPISPVVEPLGCVEPSRVSDRLADGLKSANGAGTV